MKDARGPKKPASKASEDKKASEIMSNGTTKPVGTVSNYRMDPKSDLEFELAADAFGDAHYSPEMFVGKAKRTCFHYGEDSVFVAGKRTFYGASGSDVNPSLYDVVLDCAGFVRKPWLLTASPRFAPLATTSDFLRLQWPDRAAPPVAPAWWLKIANAMPEKCEVIVACQGGHGRTGTALALFALAYDVVSTGADAIALIRAMHCKRAIESKEQELYIDNFAKYMHALQTGKVKP